MTLFMQDPQDVHTSNYLVWAGYYAVCCLLLILLKDRQTAVGRFIVIKGFTYHTSWGFFGSRCLLVQVCTPKTRMTSLIKLYIPQRVVSSCRKVKKQSFTIHLLISQQGYLKAAHSRLHEENCTGSEQKKSLQNSSNCVREDDDDRMTGDRLMTNDWQEDRCVHAESSVWNKPGGVRL